LADASGLSDAGFGRLRVLLPVPPQDPEVGLWFTSHLQVHEAQLRAWLHSRFAKLTAEDLDDLIQDAYAKVLKAHAARAITAPKAFFFAVARNLAYDHFRRRAVAVPESSGGTDELDVLEDGADFIETVSRNQEIELMTEAIQTLPDRCRQVLTLRYVYGLPHKEIAAELGITLSTVEIQITKGIKRCTAYLASRLRR